MRIPLMLLAVPIGLGLIAASAYAQQPDQKSHHTKPKNEISKLRRARKTDHTVRQVTVDPKKSPAKHTDNLSKNINHEINRESKDVNHAFQGKPKKKPHNKSKQP